MRLLLAALALIVLLPGPAAPQQTALTEGQLKSAALEMPELVKLFELKPGMTVADVGAGFGAWTMQFSKVVGPAGRVIATDIGAPQLAALRDSVKREALTNVTVIEAATDATNLPAGCCDAILIRDAYHHLTQPAAIVKSLAAALKPGGRLAVIDFPPARKPMCRRAYQPTASATECRQKSSSARWVGLSLSYEPSRPGLRVVSPRRCIWCCSENRRVTARSRRCRPAGFPCGSPCP